MFVTKLNVQFSPKLQLLRHKPYRRSYDFTEKIARLTSKILQIILTIVLADIGITTNSMLDKNSKNPAYKTFRSSLPAKQAITAGCSSCLNVKSLLGWRNCGLPKLMPIEHISFDACIMVVSFLIHVNKLLVADQPVRNLRTLKAAEMNKKGILQQGALSFSPQSPLPLSFPPPSLSTPATLAYKLMTVFILEGVLDVQTL